MFCKLLDRSGHEPQAVRVEMEEGAHSMRRAQESVPSAQGSDASPIEMSRSRYASC